MSIRRRRTGGEYAAWLASQRPDQDRTWLQRHLSHTVPRALQVRVVVSVADAGAAMRTVASLRGQTWRRWAAVLVGDAGVAGSADGLLASDVTLEPGGPRDPSALNRALLGGESADILLLLDAGDELEPDCLFELVAAFWRDPAVDAVVFDDDLLDAAGRPHAPRMRPSWSPETLLSAPYVDRAVALRRRLVARCGGLRPAAGPWALWDLLLRGDLDPGGVGRVPRVLVHRRSGRPAVDEAGRALVEEEVRRRGFDARAVLRGGAVQLEWGEDRRRVSIVVPTRHNRPLIGALLEGLATTDHPAFDVTVVDNGGRTPANEAWYDRFRERLELRVLWWDAPFNYSAVNNRGARESRGEVLVFLNDDIEVVDPAWLRRLAGWTRLDSTGAVGMQLVDRAGRIQHGGVIVGLGGFADHLFAGARPGADSPFGPASWNRNVLAVTGACLAIRRDLFESIGGFDERLVLCGSDVVLGLDAHLAGRRSICLADNGLRHLESATRGPEVPRNDYFVSYWSYAAWLHGGDPYFSPNLSAQQRIPALRHEGEAATLEVVGRVLGRGFDVYRSAAELDNASYLARTCRVSTAEVAAVHALHRARRAPAQVRTVNWYVPGLDSPFYGGINTALRIAETLQRRHGVVNRFVVSGLGPEAFVRAGIGAAFPTLAASPVLVVEDPRLLDGVPEADVDIATLWSTAYAVARHRAARRKFYLVQDFEPMFYPAGTIYALAEASYRLGLYGLCNTEHLAGIYRNRYGGTARAFTPAVDTDVFHARTRPHRDPDAPLTLFVYARPGHWRNCWELAHPALALLKERLGEGLRIVAAGSWAIPDDKDHLPAAVHLGLLDYRATGDLYRRCDMGLALTVSEHPSYLPLELMACGAAVVAFDNPAGGWLLRDGENCVLAERTVDALVDALERVAVNPRLRRRLTEQGLADIAARHGDWDAALAGTYDYLCDPEGHGAGPDGGVTGSHRADPVASARRG